MGGSLGRESEGLNSVCPTFQCASARLESLWKQTVEKGEGRRLDELRNTGAQREKKNRDTKNESERDEVWVTKGETTGKQRDSENLHRDQTLVLWAWSTIQQQSKRHWAREFVQTLNRCCPAPGGLEGTWRLSCHRIRITGLAARDTAALWRRRSMTGAVSRRWAMGPFITACQRRHSPRELLML